MIKIKILAIRILTLFVPFLTLRYVYRKYSDFLFWIKYRDSNFPRIISIEINTHCNRSCSYCPNVHAPQKSKLIDPDVFYAIVERLHNIKYSGVVDFIFFSEPTLHPKLAEYVAHVNKRVPWCVPRICTNGDLLTEASVKKLSDAGLSRIYVMRHNPTPHDWVARIDALSKKFKGFFVKMDIDEVERITGLHDFGGFVEVQKVFKPIMKDGKPSCQVHSHVGQIGVNGDWLLCCVDFDKTLAFGNLVKEDIMTIWNKPFFTMLRKELRSGVARLPKCKECPCINDRREINNQKVLARQNV